MENRKKSKPPRRPKNVRETPHDAVFKAYFSDIQVAREYILNFYPEELRKEIDLTSLRKLDTSYVSARFAKSFSDVVYGSKTLSGRDALLVFLFEHKSSQTKHIFLQLLDYMLQKWEEDVKNKQKLSVVIPTVVYHGKTGWKKRNFAADFGILPDYLSKFIPKFDYLLTDLHNTPIQVIEDLHTNYLKNLFLSLKFAWEQEYIRQYWTKIFRFGNDISDTDRVNLLTNILFQYIIRVSQFSEPEIIELNDSLKVSNIMTTYDTIVKNATERGIQQGVSLGMEKGIEKGIEKGAELQKIMLTIKTMTTFPSLTDQEIADFVEEDISFVEQIRKELATNPEYTNKIWAELNAREN